MERSEQLADRLSEVLLDGTWIANTNFQLNLENISYKQATKKVGSINTIALLTFHINYYLEGVLNVLKGGDLEIRDKFSFDMPPLESESDWIRLRTELLNNSQSFVDEVKKLSNTRLDEPFTDEKYGSIQRNIEGMIEHCYYHLGQISLIKKLLLERKYQ